MKKVLMVVRIFPPFSPVGHSIRAVKFIKYLPILGWLPIVLSIDDKMDYETTRKVGSESLLSEIEPVVKIQRTRAGETSSTYLLKEENFSRKNWLTRVIVKVAGGARRWVFRNVILPDRYLTWLPFAVKRGLKIVRNEGIDIIFTTSPPHSAILIGACLKLLTGKPLVLDYRDDWIGTPWYCSKPEIRRSIERRLERWAIRIADKVILVTEWSRNAFLDRYPTMGSEKFVLISNGCDLRDFSDVNSFPSAHANSKFKILHAGSLNALKHWGRNPAGLFQAIQKILHENPEMKDEFDIIFAGELPDEFQKLLDQMGLSDVIHSPGHIPHKEVLRLSKSADLLLAINYEGWATLIPAKIYEYWAVGGPPILLLSCPGAAASLIEQHNLGFTFDPSDVYGIEQVILTAYRKKQSNRYPRIITDGIEKFDRQVLTQKLAQVLSEVSDETQFKN